MVTVLNYRKDPVTIVNSSMILGEVEKFGWVNARPNWTIELRGSRNISIPIVSDVLVVLGRPRECLLECLTYFQTLNLS